MWQERLATALVPGIASDERIRRAADALASKGWKMQVKDLTPDLEALADAYLAALDRRVTGLGAMLGGGPNIDHLRVAALNHLVKNFKSDTASSAAEPSSLTRGPRLLRG